MADILGVQVATPTIDISGFLSTSWVYVLLIVIIGVILVVGLGIFLFFTTYTRKIQIVENSGKGWEVTKRIRARVINTGPHGVELLKALSGEYVSAYGRKFGRNTYLFAKGSDGYLYNVILGDFDEKLMSLGIEPIDRDVRMKHEAERTLIRAQFGEKKNWIERFAPLIAVFLMLVVFFVGVYIVSGKINEGLKSINSPEVANTNKETAQLLNQMASRLDNIQRGTSDSGNSNSGLVPIS